LFRILHPTGTSYGYSFSFMFAILDQMVLLGPSFRTPEMNPFHQRRIEPDEGNNQRKDPPERGHDGKARQPQAVLPVRGGRGGSSATEVSKVPLFEYECLACGRIFEVFTQRREPTAMPKCPECCDTEVERIWSTFSGRAGEGAGCATSSFGFG